LLVRTFAYTAHINSKKGDFKMTKTNLENVKINAFCVIVVVLSLVISGLLGACGG